MVSGDQSLRASLAHWPGDKRGPEEPLVSQTGADWSGRRSLAGLLWVCGPLWHEKSRLQTQMNHCNFSNTNRRAPSTSGVGGQRAAGKDPVESRAHAQAGTDEYEGGSGRPEPAGLFPLGTKEARKSRWSPGRPGRLGGSRSLRSTRRPSGEGLGDQSLRGSLAQKRPGRAVGLPADRADWGGWRSLRSYASKIIAKLVLVAELLTCRVAARC